jgi:hypothetical protein
MPSPLDADSPDWIALASAIAAVIAAAFAGIDRFWDR